MYNTPLHYGPYVYPRWGKALGVCIGATCCLQILIWAIVAISKETGTLKDVSITTMSFCRCEVWLHLTSTAQTDCHCCTCLNMWRRVYDCFSLLFLQRFQKSIRPLNSWRVNNLNSTGRVEERVEPERVEAPFTVTLTDMDFTAMTWEVGSQAWQSGEQRRTHGDEQTTLSGDRGIYYYVIRLSSAPVAVSEQTVCPAGHCGSIALFILLCMFELYFLLTFFMLCRL